jgi:hypothetical protein
MLKLLATGTIAALAVAIAPFGNGLAAADVPLTYTSGNAAVFTLDVPDFWEVRTGGIHELTAPETGITRSVPRVMSISPQVEPGVWIGFTVPDGVATIDQGVAYLRELGQFLSLDIEMSVPERRSIGGLQAIRSDGLGIRDGKKVQLTLALVDLPNNRIVAVAVLTEVGIDASWYPAINDVLQTLRAGR